MAENPAQRYIDANIQPSPMNEVNWKAAPLHFKLYRNCEHVPCAYETVEQSDGTAEDSLTQAQIGQILADIYGFTRQYHVAKAPASTQLAFSHQLSYDQEMHHPTFSTALRRPVPSGGALYPCELYLLAGSGENFPAGIYHYDAAHHALDLIRQGDYSHLLQNALAHPAETVPAYAFLLSCFFWKDGFKYGAFSYRLQGLDIGTVIAQSQVISGHYDLTATVHYQFLDRVIDDLMGLDPLHESIYTVITLSTTRQPTQNVLQTSSASGQEESSLARLLPTAEQLESIANFPLPEAVHCASLMETRDSFHPLHSLLPLKMPEYTASQSLCASDTELDLWESRYRRHSTLPDQFLPVPLTEQQFAQLLIASAGGYTNDIDGRPDFLQHTLLYCVVNRVQNIHAGVYYYHPQKHVLVVIHAGDMRRELQETLRWPMYNLSTVSVCLLPVANYKQGFEVYGDRWYRIQNMEAGILVQRLYLAAAALKLGCRASLGHQVSKTDEFLRLPEKYTSLIQIMIAPERHAYQHYEQSIVI